MTTFRTRARTLDMLGRQQIAGIPTAISELFKNAHDAYADRVEIDYYRTDKLFVLRDDGGGMTRQEFEERWLTIGTDSKVLSSDSDRRLARGDQEARPTLGEKGIGRLAIATIGPQVLVLTRARLEEGASDLTATFINWTLFACPGIDLEDIQIPVRTFAGGGLPSQSDVQEIVNSFRANAESLRPKLDESRYSSLCSELDKFVADPLDIDSYLKDPTLSGTGTGTHFIIQPATELLALDIDGDGDRTTATPLDKALLGFTNTMTPGQASPVISTAFRDHKSEEITDDVIGSRAFFTPEDFERADHHVRGHFDEYGQFRGRVSIYGKITEDHIISWKERTGQMTSCGPFDIVFAAFEGERKHSRLTDADYEALSAQTNRIGGLYLYRNGVRILPYGNTDYDWLDIELRRTKGYGHYYFSHRKMFGAVQIDRHHNRHLHEKAGREGFRENRSYRQFRSILRNFFVQMAADFFRKEGTYAEGFVETKKEVEREHVARERRERLVRSRKAAFTQRLTDFHKSLNASTPQAAADRIRAEVEAGVQRAVQMDDPVAGAEAIYRTERDARRALRELEDIHRIARPKIALNKRLQREWQTYLRLQAEIEENVFTPTRRAIDRILTEETAISRLGVDRRRRAETALDDRADVARSRTRERRRDVLAETDRVSTRMRQEARSAMEAVETEIRHTMADFEHRDVANLADAEFVAARDEAEARIVSVMDQQAQVLEVLAEQLRVIDLTGESSIEDQLAAVEQQHLTLEERTSTDLQVAQLGMAVNIVSHEFGATVRSIRHNLRRLKGWADVNDNLRGLSDDLRASFEHLDGYLSLLTPLNRRLYRKPTRIRGKEVFEFVRDLFADRIRRHGITLVHTASFAKTTIHGYRSTFYPPFVNLVDNAVYWLSSLGEGRERQITLDAAGHDLVVKDSGPGIHPRDYEAVFEYGFTRKPGGTGMGLAIARDTLRGAGYDLLLPSSQPEAGALFVVRKADIEEKEA